MMIKKLIILLSAVALIIFLCTACENTTSSNDEETIDSILSYFYKLAEIPRPSGSEQQVSDYLKSWAEEQGYKVIQDEFNNIIFDVPASKGKENVPLIALQGHMDMIAISEDDYNFNPQNDSIIVNRNGNTISAEETSLGADNGIGISLMQYISEYNTNHGPLRVIITTDEECNQTGAINIDKSIFDDVKYLINIDSEESDSLTISSASYTDIKITKNIEAVAPSHDTAIKVSVSGSESGHSGIDINKNRMNSIVSLFSLLNIISDNGIKFQISAISGGTASNIIPKSAEAIIICNSSDESVINKIVENYSAEINKKYGKENPKATANVEKCENFPESALSQEIMEDIIDFATEIHNGVYTMSSKFDGLVECSSNLGIVNINEKDGEIVISVRSSETKPEKELLNKIEKSCNDHGFSFASEKLCIEWPIKENSKLTEMAKEIYNEQNGEYPEILPIHGGLECGWFAQTNSDMDIISVGPDIINAHSTLEECNMNSVLKTLNLINGILEKSGE